MVTAAYNAFEVTCTARPDLCLIAGNKSFIWKSNQSKPSVATGDARHVPGNTRHDNLNVEIRFQFCC